MKHKYLLLLPIFFIAAAVQHLPTHTKKTALQANSLSRQIHTQDKKIKAIIIAWCTIFEASEKAIERNVKKHLGLFKSIGLLFSGIPSNEVVKKQLFELLGTIDPIPLSQLSTPALQANAWQPDNPSWEIDYEIPPIFAQHLVASTYEDEQAIYQHVFNYLETTNQITSDARRRILKGVAEFIFQSEQMNGAMYPIPDMIELAQKLKAHGYELILVGNVPGYAWDQFMENYTDAALVKELFAPKNIYISGKEQCLKTSEAMYKKIIKNHNLATTNYLVIDCNPHNLTYAKKIGMKTAAFNPQQTNFIEFQENLPFEIS